MGFYFSSFHRLLLTCLFSLIRLEFIDTKTFTQVCCKLSVGGIQIGHTDFIPPQVCGKSWRGCLLGVHTCSHQFISLFDITPLQVICSSLILLIFDLYVLNSLDQRSLNLNFFFGCVNKLSLCCVDKCNTKGHKDPLD